MILQPKHEQFDSFPLISLLIKLLLIVFFEIISFKIFNLTLKPSLGATFV